MNKKEIKAIEKANKKEKDFNKLANEKTEGAKKKKTNLTPKVENLYFEKLGGFNKLLKRKEASLSQRVKLLQDHATSKEGLEYLKHFGFGTTEKDIKNLFSVPNILKCYSNVIIDNEKKFFKPKKVNDKNRIKLNAFKYKELFSEEGNVSIELQILEQKKGFKIRENETLIYLENKKGEIYVIQLIDKLSFFETLQRLVSFRNESNKIAARKIKEESKESK